MISTTRKIELEKLCSIITDGTHQTPKYSDTGYIFLSSKNVVGEKIDWVNVKYIPEYLHNELYSRISPQLNDILLAKNGTTGVAALVDKNHIFDIYVSLALLRPTKDVEPKYLLYAINSPSTKRFFNSNLKGIGVPNLHLKYIRKTLIPIYTLEEQKKIATILGKVSNLISLQKQQLEKLDLLVKSRFIEMFGDIEINPFNWNETIFGNISKVRQGLQIPISERKTKMEENSFPYITIQFLNGRKQAEYIKNPKKIVLCCKDDILMTRTGNTGMVITNVAGVFHNNFFLIDFDRKVLNKIFLVYYLKSNYIQAEITKRAGTSTIPDLNHGDFYKIKLYLPPIDLQNQFSDFVHQIEKQKSIIRRGLDKLELLKKALMQEYFG